MVSLTGRARQRGPGPPGGTHGHADQGRAGRGPRADRRRPVGRGSRAASVRNRQLLDDLGGRYVEVVGADVAPALVQVARAENATQLVLGPPTAAGWPSSCAARSSTR